MDAELMWTRIMARGQGSVSGFSAVLLLPKERGDIPRMCKKETGGSAFLLGMFLCVIRTRIRRRIDLGFDFPLHRPTMGCKAAVDWNSCFGLAGPRMS